MPDDKQVSPSQPSGNSGANSNQDHNAAIQPANDPHRVTPSARTRTVSVAASILDAKANECAEPHDHPCSPETLVARRQAVDDTSATPLASSRNYTHFTPAMLLDEDTLSKFEHVANDILLGSRYTFNTYLKQAQFSLRDRDALRGSIGVACQWCSRPVRLHILFILLQHAC